MNDKFGFGLLSIGAMFVLCLIFGYGYCFVTVDNGEVGTLSWYGDLDNETLDPGPHLVNPLKKRRNVNIQLKKEEEEYVLPTKVGLPISMKATLLYRIDKSKVVEVMRNVGKDYEEKVVKPYFRNSVKDVAGEHIPEDFYNENRSTVETAIATKITPELLKHGFIVESVMILDPKLPDVVKARIEAKVGAEQDVIRMGFVLKQKTLEAEAKVIEAKGIADAQKIIKKDLDDNYLRFLWVEALKAHQGATIYVPTGNDGMPFFKPVNGKE